MGRSKGKNKVTDRKHQVIIDTTREQRDIVNFASPGNHTKVSSQPIIWLGLSGMRRVVLLCAMFFSAPTLALAFCSQPYGDVTLPDAPGSFHKPSAPYCLSGYKFSGKHTCSDWEISSYKSELEDYLDKLRTFANEAVNAANEAITFANDAKAYAKCESQDVLSEFN
ncbi:hypothetical protein [Agrobacterium cavarae]|uniref:hypothetical protein n=1 Tax=Agrobacterium cavarae TaxID=2528239 RepID=UPI002FDB7D4D